jgi:Phosphodiester glycosidase
MAADHLLPHAATTVTPPAPISSSGAGGARRVASARIGLADGRATTIHVASYDLARTALKVVRLVRPAPLEAWCANHAVADALVGGYFTRPDGTPLGELRTGGIARASRRFDAPWDAVRACVHVAGGTVAITRRPELPALPRGDLLQAGPLLVRDGCPVVGDEEGFSAGRRQFDSDITDGRYPRAALAVTRDGRVLALACDGRADDEAGLTLAELAETMVALGAASALNLDGGGSTSLVCDGRLRNVPREQHGTALAGGRAVSTALVFTAR